MGVVVLAGRGSGAGKGLAISRSLPVGCRRRRRRRRQPRAADRSAQAGAAWRQRVRKTQPEGGAEGLGGSPGEGCAAGALRPGPDARRRRDQSAGVGMARPIEHGRSRPSSITRPRYITATRSQRWRTTTARSWLMNSIASPKSRLSRASRSRICAWIDTSSGGTRAHRPRGSPASWRAPGRCPRAGAGRRRIRAESGRRGSCPAHGLQQRGNACRPFGRRGEIVDCQTIADLRADAPAGFEAAVGILEDDLHPSAQLPPLRRRQAVEALAVERDMAGGRRQQAEEQQAACVLARTALADDSQCSPGGIARGSRR